MRPIRRGFLALALASCVAVAVRLRGSTGVPPQHGGWRELSSSDLK